ncbi:hypothetical protein CCR75_000289 [Bremia lactucae]|uniref:RNA helicase n=1 Tax=Bremia lactucae TaxID=4779 RepID=A0A976FM01_BRELC|nr:hypothetical protein CCR75_000289 [Bremia lactucae]
MAFVPIVKCSSDQRHSLPGEPVCVICGRYGEYVCDATDQDVCSLECREKSISRQQTKHSHDTHTANQSDKLRLQLGIQISIESASERPPQWPNLFVDFKQQFQDKQLPNSLLVNLSVNGFERPTPVQMQILPCVLQGHHVLVSAPTGTGKTASYLIPAIAQIMFAREGLKEVLALVLAPARELAIQIETVAKALMHGILEMKTALLIGGLPLPTQRYRLQTGVQLIVATPGRFLDIVTNYSEGEEIIPAIRTCVIDEVDLMLHGGFRPQMTQIVALLCYKEVQFLFFSATVSDEVEVLVQQLLKPLANHDYYRIDIQRKEEAIGKNTAHYSINPSVCYEVRWALEPAKKNELFEFLKEKHDESTVGFIKETKDVILVFVGSKKGASLLADAIKKRCGVVAAAIHADKTQQERLSVLEAFVMFEVPVLVATNVLSRGIDLLNVQNVVVYDLPKTIPDYIHLIGRTGRADDVSGRVLTLLNTTDRPLFRDLVPLLRQMNASVPVEMYREITLKHAKEKAQSSQIVMSEAKRAFRIRMQMTDDFNTQALDWKEWKHQNPKRRRIGP